MKATLLEKIRNRESAVGVVRINCSNSKLINRCLVYFIKIPIDATH